MKPSTQCPTCGRPFPQDLPVTLPVSGPVRQNLVNIIAGRPDGITRAELMDKLYSNALNAPETANTISMLVYLANQQLAPQGYHIWSTKGHGSRYYLERLEHADPVE